MQKSSEVHSNSMVRAARRVSSCLSVKTSVTRVSGMKALLPLTLSTTSLDTQVYKPQQVEEIQSPVTTINRLTFGGQQDPTVEFQEDSPKKLQKSPRSKKLSRRGGHFPRLPLSIHPERRDIPVYTDAGSPIPSPAYFSTEFPHTLSPTNSCLSEEEWLAGCSSPNTETSPHPNNKTYPMASTKTSPDQSFGSSKEQTSYNSSQLSFQCLGEYIDVKEPDVRTNPADGMANLDSMCLPDILAQSMPPKSIVEGWLGSAHSMDGDGDSIADAMPPSVRLSANTSTTFSNPAFKIPPRSSSLTGNRPSLSWKRASRDSTDEVAAHESPFTAYDSHAPSPIFDTESLPSSVSSHDEPPTPPPKEKDYVRQYPPLSQGFESASSQFHNTEPINFHLDVTRDRRSNLHSCALSIIEDLIRYFPFSTFIDYRYYIYSVRTQIYTCTPHPQNDFLNPNPPLQHERPTSPFRSFPSRRMTLSLSNLTRTTFSRTPSPDTFKPGPGPPKQTISTHLDLDPLQRIFSQAPTSMTQALYAYILAYILITHIHPPSPPPGTPKSPSPSQYQTHRTNSIRTISPSRIPNKAASMLGIPILDHMAPHASDPHVSGLIEDFVLSQRIKAARTSLENSIFCLVRGMGGDGEDGVEEDGGGVRVEKGEPKGFVEGILGRALVEVVRGAERRAEGVVCDDGGF